MGIKKSVTSGRLYRVLRRRKGMTLVELLGVMVVIAILASIAVGGVLAAQERARVTNALVALDGYSDAFTNVCVGNPGIGTDRLKNWVDSSSYTSENGLKKIVAGMNELLDDELMMYWDPASKCYRSAGKDPWGDSYILTEYPVSTDGVTNYYDPTAGGKGVMAIAVWCTGNNESILTEGKVSGDTKGIAIAYVGGLINTRYQGVRELKDLTDWTVTVQ